MTTMQVVLIIVIAIIVIAAVAVGPMLVRRRDLRRRFGPEYDRLVSERESRTEAEKELRARERRHAELDLRPLSEESRRRYLAEWEEVQARFLDSPQEAARAGDELVSRLVAERGYPTGDFEEQLADLSVEHGHTLGRYREAHDTVQRHERGAASTEQLRQALVHYRALFTELVGERPTPASHRSTDGRADGSTDGRADGSIDGSTDGRAGAAGREEHRHEERRHEEHREEDRDALRR